MLAKITPYRCANCGSGKVMPYANGAKAVFSLRNLWKQQEITEYRCPECSAVLSHDMNASDKAVADSIVLMGGESQQAVAGFLRKYKNLEIDPVLQMVCLNQ